LTTLSHCLRTIAFLASVPLAACSSSGGAPQGATGADCPQDPWSGGKTYSGDVQGSAGNGYTYSLWSNGVGSGSMTVAGVDAKFSATWDSPGDLLARVGLGFNSSKTADQLGTLAADFSESKTGAAGGYSYIGIYGWSVNPLHEYYIVDDWFGSQSAPGNKVGTITVDGGAYDVRTRTQTDQPSIMGNQTFVQFWSIRQQARACGHISISEHFSQWAGLGLQLGNLEEARLLVEVGEGKGTGNAIFTTATVTLN
jgi:endo-1,4-beta-xylanase